MTKYCIEFTNASNYIFKWFSKQSGVKEESLTDWFLYYLYENLAEFNYVEYSRWDEGKYTGADFDFWIISETEYLSLRIQAKKMSRTGNHYSALTYPSNTKKQINLLISSSTYPLRPFYLFYNNDNLSKCERENSGTFLTDAQRMMDMLNSGITNFNRQVLLDNSAPLECLFCCPLNGSIGQNLEGVRVFMETYFHVEDEHNSGFSDSLPPYIELLLRKKVSDDEFLEEFQYSLPEGTNRIVVLDVRNKENLKDHKY